MIDMERKIGEIFEYNGKWYQCIPDTTDDNCNNCFFQKRCSNITGDCSSTNRSDGKSVAFKKFEKVGEPYERFLASNHSIKVQRYRLPYRYAILPTEPIMILEPNYKNSIEIQIKQNEDMDENKLNLKPFSLEAAKAGKPVCTRDGRKARIICFDRDWDMHIVALVADPLGESVHYYLSNGKVDFDRQLDDDLMMSPEKKEGWVNVYKKSIYNTKEDAFNRRDKENYLMTIKVGWEE